MSSGTALVVLSDRDIMYAIKADQLTIEPYDPKALQPASYDLTLDREILVPNNNTNWIDMANVQPNHMVAETVGPQGFCLEQGDFILASTRETVKIGHDLLGRVEGKSSIGRLGLMVHITAGFIDPGFHGKITLEVVNLAPWDIVLYPGQRIGQIAFSRMSSRPLRPYGQAGNHYQGQTGPQESRFEMQAEPS
jgi:dCTP deaminase